MPSRLRPTSILLSILCLLAPAARADDAEALAIWPKVPGKLRLKMTERREDPPGGGKVKVVERTADWEVSETAIIICDVKDRFRR